jgi:Tfp pilus assembly protein PilN
MFSLLPEEYRKKMQNEYKIRLAIIGFSGLIVLAVISGVFIFPTYLRISTENNISSIQKQALENQIILQTGQNSGEDIKSVKQNMSIASLDRRSVISAIGAVIQAQSQDIKLTNFSYAYNSKASTLSINGTASNRQSLQSFQKNLSAHKLFTSAELPLSDYAKDSNIPFSINLVGQF